MITVRVKLSRTQEHIIDEIAYRYDALRKRRVTHFAPVFTEIDFIYLEYDFETTPLANAFLTQYNEILTLSA